MSDTYKKNLSMFNNAGLELPIFHPIDKTDEDYFFVRNKNIFRSHECEGLMFRNRVFCSFMCRETLFGLTFIFLKLNHFFELIEKSGFKKEYVIENSSNSFKKTIDMFVGNKPQDERSVSIVGAFGMKTLSNLLFLNKIERFMSVGEDDITKVEFIEHCDCFKFNLSSFWVTSPVHLSLASSIMKNCFWGSKPKVFKSLELILRASDIVFSNPSTEAMWPIKTTVDLDTKALKMGNYSSLGCYTFSRMLLNECPNVLDAPSFFYEADELKKTELWITKPISIDLIDSILDDKVVEEKVA